MTAEKHSDSADNQVIAQETLNTVSDAYCSEFWDTVPVFAAEDPINVVNNLSDFIFGFIRAVGIILLGWLVCPSSPIIPLSLSMGFGLSPVAWSSPLPKKF